MGFKDIRNAAIEAIQQGRVQHESRKAVNEKNLFLTGEVSADQVIDMLSACKGTQHESSPHHLEKSVEVHVFKPEVSIKKGEPKERWYLKLYLLEPDVWFISVHKSGKGTN